MSTTLALPKREGGKDPWADRYERLRRSGLRDGNRVHDSEGLVVFLRKGAAAWMQAVAARRPEPEADCAPRVDGLPTKEAGAELTDALTTMVLSATEGLR